MICPTPACGARLRVSHTHTTEAGQTRRAECPTCKCVYTAVTLIVSEGSERGEGAASFAKRLGELEVVRRKEAAPAAEGEGREPPTAAP